MYSILKTYKLKNKQTSITNKTRFLVLLNVTSKIEQPNITYNYAIYQSLQTSIAIITHLVGFNMFKHICVCIGFWVSLNVYTI